METDAAFSFTREGFPLFRSWKFTGRFLVVEKFSARSFQQLLNQALKVFR
jgi:hypothetical protein